MERSSGVLTFPDRWNADEDRVVVFVGEQPGKTDEQGPIEAFRSGYSAQRLSWLMNCRDIDDFKKKYYRINLLPEFHDTWLGDEAEQAAGTMISMTNRRAVFILCGKKVAAAFHVGDLSFFIEKNVGFVTLVVMPHPSGKNRWWNFKTNVAIAVTMLRRYRK